MRVHGDAEQPLGARGDDEVNLVGKQRPPFRRAFTPAARSSKRPRSRSTSSVAYASRAMSAAPRATSSAPSPATSSSKVGPITSFISPHFRTIATRIQGASPEEDRWRRPACANNSRNSATYDPRASPARERPSDIIARCFPAYVGRQERTAFELMRRSSEDDTCVFLTLSGAMTPAGLHQSCIIPLIERGLIDCITTTGANLYHDAHRIIGHRIREIDPNAGDLQYRLARIIRIYDLGFWEETLLETDKLFSRASCAARVPEEDDDARAALPARQAHRATSRRRSA